MSRGRLEGVILLALALGYWRWAHRIPPFGVRDPVGPTAFPTLLAAALAVAGILLLVTPEEPAPTKAGRPLQVTLVFVLLVVYAMLFTRAGFLLATFLFLSGTIALFAPTWRWRIPVYAALMTGLLLVLFRWGLGVTLPPGVFGPGM